MNCASFVEAHRNARAADPVHDRRRVRSATSGGRALADYGDDHVAAIRRYLSLRQQFPPQAIKVLIAGGTTAPSPVQPGITLQVDPDLLGQLMDQHAFLDRLKELVGAVFKELPDAKPSHADRKRSR